MCRVKSELERTVLVGAAMNELCTAFQTLVHTTPHGGSMEGTHADPKQWGCLITQTALSPSSCLFLCAQDGLFIGLFLVVLMFFNGTLTFRSTLPGEIPLADHRLPLYRPAVLVPRRMLLSHFSCTFKVAGYTWHRCSSQCECHIQFRIATSGML